MPQKAIVSTTIDTIDMYNKIRTRWKIFFHQFNKDLLLFHEIHTSEKIFRKVAQINNYLSSASFIHRSRTGLIFWALFGVISNFSNLCKSKNVLMTDELNKSRCKRMKRQDVNEMFSEKFKKATTTLQLVKHVPKHSQTKCMYD